MSANKITSLSSALISPLWACLSVIVVFVVCSVSSQDPINNQGQVQQQQQLWVEPPMNLVPVPVPGPAPENNVQPLISLPYPYQTRQFYYPQQQQGLQGGFYQPYGQQYQQQQYPNNYGQFQQYPQYFSQNGFGNPSQGFYRPPPTTTTAAATTTTAAGATTTTTTTPRPLQVGVSTLFPLVGAGSGFGRPGSNNILNGQTAAFGAGLPFQYYQQG